ncbi:uncharacterized protein LOC130990339 isoform X2 [Salvia miltiorrhiza]|uniref:uncharacterized protein LOC130990339 isoform X2 n=1 Tax=Salvia miltiorrhiza TaxID=226208 RepID=UPI0025ACB3CD|nr:uncharacterized protein LOC130990339 isoform X2 [Salvia miltiorrhiza]
MARTKNATAARGKSKEVSKDKQIHENPKTGVTNCQATKVHTKNKGKGVLQSSGSEADVTNFEANARKRKANEIGGSSGDIPIQQPDNIVVSDAPLSPVAMAKKIRKEKRQASLENYKQLQVRPAEDYPSLFTRSTPCVMYKAVREMSDLQHFAVAQMGFDHLLELLVKDMPGKLNYWLLDRFNYKRCEIQLSCGTKIPVTADDVYRVFGFPNGGKEMPLLNRDDTTPLLEQWRAFFPNTNPRNIKINELKDVMLSCEDGGRWFKIHFMLMVAHCLIESTANGCVFPRIIGCLEDLDTVRDWNWCEYVIDSLIRNKKDWEINTAQYYVGPTLFLTVFYVDRVRWANNKICRKFPLFMNWDSKKLRDRESNEIASSSFGDGIVLDPIIVEEPLLSASAKLGKKLELYLRTRDEIFQMINSAKDELLVDEDFKMKLEETRTHLISPPYLLTSFPVDRVKIPDENVDEVIESPKKTIDIDDEFWSDPEVERSCEEIIKKTCAQNTVSADGPSFSLGLTQYMRDDSTVPGVTGEQSTVCRVMDIL